MDITNQQTPQQNQTVVQTVPQSSSPVETSQAPTVTPAPKPASPKPGLPKAFIFLILGIVTAAVILGTIGYFRNEEQKKIPAPTSTPASLAPTSPPTTGMQTYSNTDYNFSIQYPATLTMEESGLSSRRVTNAVRFFSEKPPISPTTLSYTISVTAIESSNSANVTEYIDNLQKELNTQLTREVLKLDGNPAEKVKGFPSRTGSLDVYTIKNNVVYVLSLEPYNEDFLKQLPDAEPTFTQMLTTFRFAQQTSVDSSSKVANLGEFCEGRSTTRCADGLICRVPTGGAEDAPGRCVKP